MGTSIPSLSHNGVRRAALIARVYELVDQTSFQPSEADEAAGDSEEGVMDLGATVEADDQPLEVVKVSEGRSTTQRTRPSPEPCSVLRRAITGLTPRARTRRRCASWS